MNVKSTDRRSTGLVTDGNVALGFPGGSDDKESVRNAGDPGSILDLGRSPGEGNGYPLHYSALENYMDREARQTIIHGDTESDMTERLSQCVRNNFGEG